MRLAIRIAVVLPHPEGPTITQISPAGTSRLRSSTAAESVPGYRFVTCSYLTTEAESEKEPLGIASGADTDSIL
jgi:hypothetical protein